MIPFRTLLKISAAFIRKDFFTDVSYTISFLMRWLGICISVFIFYYLSKLVRADNFGAVSLGAGDYFSFVIVGLAAMSCFNACLNGLADSVAAEQNGGLFEIFLSMPMRLPVLLFSFSAYNLLMGLMAGGLYLYLGFGLSKVYPAAINTGAAVFFLLLSTLCFLGLGLIASAGVILFKKGEQLIRTAAQLLWILGGVYFPISVFPPELQKISLYLPSTYALQALRAAIFNNAPLKTLASEAAVLSIFTVVFLGIGYYLFKEALKCAQKKGTIVLF